MTPFIDTLSEDLLYASPESPEIARLDPSRTGPVEAATDPEETGHDRPEA